MCLPSFIRAPIVEPLQPLRPSVFRLPGWGKRPGWQSRPRWSWAEVGNALGASCVCPDSGDPQSEELQEAPNQRGGTPGGWIWGAGEGAGVGHPSPGPQAESRAFPVRGCSSGWACRAPGTGLSLVRWRQASDSTDTDVFCSRHLEPQSRHPELTLSRAKSCLQTGEFCPTTWKKKIKSQRNKKEEREYEEKKRKRRGQKWRVWDESAPHGNNNTPPKVFWFWHSSWTPPSSTTGA